jgi:hypothetical protein
VQRTLLDAMLAFSLLGGRLREVLDPRSCPVCAPTDPFLRLRRTVVPLTVLRRTAC